MRSVLFDSGWGPLAVSLAVGCLLLMAALFALAKPRGAWLRNRIGPYQGPDGGARERSKESDQAWRKRMEGVFGATERRFNRTGMWQGLERMLARADERITAAQFVWLSFAIAVGLALLLVIITGSAAAAVLAAVSGAAFPVLWLSHKGHRRTRAFEDALPDVLSTMAGSLKVGHSFNQSMSAIVEEGQEPVATEFDRVLTETRFGRPMDEALEELARRVDSHDLEYVVMSVRIQRQVGGSLAGLFDVVAHTVRERQQFRRKVRALTAMGRLSAYILVGLPFATGLLLRFVSPSYMSPLWTSSTGRMLIIIALAMMACGSLILKRIVNVKG